MPAVILCGSVALVLVIWIAARLARISAPPLPGVRLDEAAACYIDEAALAGQLCIVANPPASDEDHNDDWGCRAMLPQLDTGAMLVLEVAVPVDNQHACTVTVTGHHQGGQRVLRVAAWDVADAIAAVVLHLRDRTGLIPRVYFTWPDRHPLAQFVQFLLLGTGEIILLTRQLLHEAEPDRARRPSVHVS